MRTIIFLHLALSEFHNQYLRVVWDREVVHLSSNYMIIKAKWALRGLNSLYNVHDCT